MDRQAAKVVALGVPVIAAAQIDIIDPRRIDPRAIEHGIDDMRRQERRFGIVEGASIGLANAGTGGGDDRCITHCSLHSK